MLFRSATRQWLTNDLRQLGFAVVDSQTNFVWCTHSAKTHQSIYEALKARKILVRFMKFPGVEQPDGKLFDGIRITIGTDDECRQLIVALKDVLA